MGLPVRGQRTRTQVCWIPRLGSGRALMRTDHDGEKTEQDRKRGYRKGGYVEGRRRYWCMILYGWLAWYGVPDTRIEELQCRFEYKKKAHIRGTIFVHCDWTLEVRPSTGERFIHSVMNLGHVFERLTRQIWIGLSQENGFESSLSWIGFILSSCTPIIEAVKPTTLETLICSTTIHQKSGQRHDQSPLSV